MMQEEMFERFINEPHVRSQIEAAVNGMTKRYESEYKRHFIDLKDVVDMDGVFITKDHQEFFEIISDTSKDEALSYVAHVLEGLYSALDGASDCSCCIKIGDGMHDAINDLINATISTAMLVNECNEDEKE